MAEIHGKIGGASPKEEIITGAVIKGMTAYLNSKEDEEWMQKMLRNLPPISMLLLDPLARHSLLALMPDFGRPELARAFKDIIEAGGHTIEDMAHDAKKNGPLTDDAFAAAIGRAGKEALGIKYAVLGRCFHRLECGELPAARQQTSGKKGEAPKPRNDFREISLPEAIRQRYFPCQFCISGAHEAKLPAEKPVASAKRDPLQIIAGCKDEKAKTGFEDLIKALDAEYKKKVWAALKHLSSEEEFMGMMTVARTLKPEEYPAFVDQLEQMLQMDEEKRVETRGLFSSIGGIIQGGGELAAELISSVWNTKVKPEGKPVGETGAKPGSAKSFGIIKAFTF